MQTIQSQIPGATGAHGGVVTRHIGIFKALLRYPSQLPGQYASFCESCLYNDNKAIQKVFLVASKLRVDTLQPMRAVLSRPGRMHYIKLQESARLLPGYQVLSFFFKGHVQ